MVNNKNHSVEVWAEVGTNALQAKAPESIHLDYKISSHRFSSGGISLDLFEFYFALGLSSQAAATILFDLINRHARKRPGIITINRKEIAFDKGEIKKVLHQYLACAEN